jgi:hypothetical protein
LACLQWHEEEMMMVSRHRCQLKSQHHDHKILAIPSMTAKWEENMLNIVCVRKKK